MFGLQCEYVSRLMSHLSLSVGLRTNEEETMGHFGAEALVLGLAKPQSLRRLLDLANREQQSPLERLLFAAVLELLLLNSTAHPQLVLLTD